MKMPEAASPAYAAPVSQKGVLAAGKANGQENDNHDFPTLLNIEWPMADAEEAPDQLMQSVSVDGLAVDHLADDGQQVQMANNINEVIADSLLFNSQFNVSIQVLHADSMNSEATKLIDDFNRAVANSAGSLASLPFGSAIASIANTQKNAMNGMSGDELAAPSGIDTGLLGDAVAKAGAAVGKSMPDLGVAAKPVSAGTAETAQGAMGQSARNIPVVPPANMSVADDVDIQAIKMDKSLPAKTGPDNQLPILSQVTVSALPNVVARLSASADARQTIATPVSDTTAPVRATNNVRVVELQLIPKNLGVVELKITKTEQGAQITLQVETAQAERMLMSEKSSVYEAMKNIGMPVEEMKITLAPKSDANNDMKFDKQAGSEFQQDGLEAETRSDADAEQDQKSDIARDPNGLEKEIDAFVEGENKPIGLYF